MQLDATVLHPDALGDGSHDPVGGIFLGGDSPILACPRDEISKDGLRLMFVASSAIGKLHKMWSPKCRSKTLLELNRWSYIPLSPMARQ